MKWITVTYSRDSTQRLVNLDHVKLFGPTPDGEIDRLYMHMVDGSGPIEIIGTLTNIKFLIRD